jgi:cytoskeletal protein CcmA (bactofilin family)
MGLFRKKRVEDPPAFTLDTSGVGEGITYIGRNLTVKGRVSADDDIQILGTHTGELDLNGNLDIRQSANIVGNVQANTITVSGTVEGSVMARKKLHIYYTAKIKGEITTPVIAIQEGAQFDGKVNMGDS